MRLPSSIWEDGFRKAEALKVARAEHRKAWGLVQGCGVDLELRYLKTSAP